MPRKKFVAGNWKMYTTLSQARELSAAIASGVTSDKVTVGVFPPFPWLSAVAEVLKGSRVGLGAQDCAAEKEGAFTGQVAAPMLLEAGCRFAIVGHSERRHGLHETDELLNGKIKAVLSSGLVGIFCIGELLAEREANQTESVLQRQLARGLAGLDPAQVARLAIAYEPVWAIGTGRVATDQQAQEAHAFIRKTFASLFGAAAAESVPIGDGGSVKPDNVAGLMAQPDVDGALVGGASLKADSFLAIVKAAGG
ncbi:MAG TPA: triose-phosphate isomerase [Gemmata sp.]|nr:triose-phosphate isomerase [Gemmata sp.]